MSNSETADPIISNLVAWLQGGGCDLSKRETRYVSGKGRTSFAAKRLRPNEIVIYIPREYLMTNLLAEQSDIGLAIAKSNVTLQSEHSVLAAYMLQEKRNHFSFWKPYLDSLPDNFDNVPLFFDENRLGELKGSTIVERVLNRRYALATEYRTLAGAVPAFKSFSWQEFLWARTAITTRCFGMTIDGRKAVAMVPLMDIANHSNAAKTHWGGHLTGIAITAKGAFAKGEELFISYGEKSTNRFFSSYGFINEDRSGDECSITPHLNYLDELYHAKLQLLKGEHYQEFALRACYNDSFKKCLSYLRFVVQDCLLDKKTQPGLITTDNEIKALELLRRCCRQSLGHYDTTLEDDQKQLLASSIEDSNQRNCIEMRSREKIVLNTIIDFVAHALAIWQNPDNAAKRADASSDPMVRDYFNDILYEPKIKR